MSDQELQARLRLAVDLAQRGGELTLPWFHAGGYAQREKGDGSPVTEADLACERLVREGIATAFAHDGIIGEEFGEHAGTTGYTWVIDPIDGTASFVRGVPLYGTLVAVMREGRSVAGAICLPALGEMVWAGRGLGAWRAARGGEATPARVSTVATLDDSVVCLSAADYFKKAGTLSALTAMSAGLRSTRGWGDCYGHFLVATGRVEASVDPIVNLWDVAPAQVIIEEAGGRYTDWDGRGDVRSAHCIVSNGAVHEALLAMVRG